ncbi:MAG: hypothetical protein MUO77_00530 [Anaerolineales bacterium]|nr:hypothetical protein [Anaerolineales bacterium]
MYKVTVASNNNLRPNHDNLQSGASLPDGIHNLIGDRLWTCDKNNNVDPSFHGSADNWQGDQWLHVTQYDNNDNIYIPIDYWLAIKHHGQPFGGNIQDLSYSPPMSPPLPYNPPPPVPLPSSTPSGSNVRTDNVTTVNVSAPLPSSAPSGNNTLFIVGGLLIVAALVWWGWTNSPASAGNNGNPINQIFQSLSIMFVQSNPAPAGNNDNPQSNPAPAGNNGNPQSKPASVTVPTTTKASKSATKVPATKVPATKVPTMKVLQARITPTQTRVPTMGQPVEGCTDSTANNYNSYATVDNRSCTYTVYGCTDKLMDNYTKGATVDDGSCYKWGCTYVVMDNYNAKATNDDGSCYKYGCTDGTAKNFDLFATIDNGNCTYADVYGCTDPDMDNYQSDATVDVGNCYKWGCMHGDDPNWDPKATLWDDDPCWYNWGCTDVNATNYDSNAEQDDGSYCEYN